MHEAQTEVQVHPSSSEESLFSSFHGSLSQYVYITPWNCAGQKWPL